MKKGLITILCFCTWVANTQVTNYLENQAATETQFKITNSVSVDQGLRFGINAGNDGYIRLAENQFLSFFTNDIEHFRLTSLGDVGLGTTGPISQLHLSTAGGRDGLLTTDPLSSPFSYSFNSGDGLAIANTNGTLDQKIELTGNPADVLLGDGTFGLLDGDADWYDVASPGNTPININNSIYTHGSVGIGTLTPLAKLHVYKNTVQDPFLVNNGLYSMLHVSESGRTGIGHIALPNTFLNITNQNHAPGLVTAVRIEANNLTTNGIGLNINANATSGTKGISVAAIGSDGYVYGIYSDAGNPTTRGVIHYGVYGRARNGLEYTMGVHGEVPGSATASSVYTAGVNANNQATFPGVHYGMHSVCHNRLTVSGTTTQYGIYAAAIPGREEITNTAYGGFFKAHSGGHDIGVFAEALENATDDGLHDLAGYFNGDVVFAMYWGPSDENLKKNIENIENASDILNQINPKQYDFRTDEFPSIGLSKKHQYGIISQDMEKVLPELVQEIHHPENRDENGKIIHEAIDYKAISYNSLIPILIQGHKEQQVKIDSLNDELDVLTKRMEKLENLLSGSKMPTSDITNELQDVTLKNIGVVVLDQNVPNPFAEQTIIGYDIPTSVSFAELIFSTQDGKIIKTIQIEGRGVGNIRVFGEDLSSGLYNYTLVADGVNIDTKKMVKLN